MKTRVSPSWVIVLPILILFTGGKAFGASGEDIFKAQKCSACHGVTKSHANNFQDQLKKKGPDLWYAGSKYQKKWLESYLQKPKPVRPLNYNSIDKKNDLKHPALAAADAKAVAEYLGSLKSKLVAQGIIKKASAGIRGKILFQKKQACYGCHRIQDRGKESGGYTGPSLVDAGKRLQGDWIYSYLKDPKPFEAAGRMPYYSHLNDNEIKTISEYVMSF